MNITTEEMQEFIIETIDEAIINDEFNKEEMQTSSLRDKGYLTNDNGLEITTKSGQTFVITIQEK